MKNPIEKRFPIGCEIINLGHVHAIVRGYADNYNGTFDLICAEIKPTGKVARNNFRADANKCERA